MYRDETTMESFKLGAMCIFWGEKFDILSFYKIQKFSNPFDVIKWKWGQKGGKLVYYIPTVIKISNSIFMVFSNLVIPFRDQLFKIMILLPIPSTSFWRYSKIGSKEAEICISSTVGKKDQNP